ncbi:MAG TPA: GerMN domain-containing protein [Clostridiaceae bacterium]|nr:GerMN domain-containing protein [Clostridiaceae bacterium]
MKRLISLLVLACLVFTSSLGLVGCSGLEKEQKSDTTKTTKTSIDTIKEEQEEEDTDYEKRTDITPSGTDTALNTISNENTGEPKKDNIQEDIPSLWITLYYQDRDGYIVPASRKIAKQEGIARAAVSLLVDNSINREEIEYFGLYPVLPSGTEILGLNIKEGIATIDFDKDFLNYSDETTEKNIVSSVVYTLTEFSTIEGVKILINGHTVNNMKYNTNLSGVLGRDNTLINSDRINLDKDMAKQDVYFYKRVNDRYEYLLPVSRMYPKTGSSDTLALITRFLSEDPGIEHLYTQVPNGVELLNNSMDGSTLVLDFDARLTSYGGGTAREYGIINQFLYTVRGMGGIDRIRFLVMGKPANFPEGTSVSKDYIIPALINSVIDE